MSSSTPLIATTTPNSSELIIGCKKQYPAAMPDTTVHSKMNEHSQPVRPGQKKRPHDQSTSSTTEHGKHTIMIRRRKRRRMQKQRRRPVKNRPDIGKGRYTKIRSRKLVIVKAKLQRLMSGLVTGKLDPSADLYRCQNLVK